MDHDAITESVRNFCAERYYQLERSLRPLVDNSFGEINPGHVAVYVATLKELGKLYQTHKPPMQLQNLVPMDKVQELIAGIREQHARELTEAVAAAELRARMEAADGQQLSIQAARSTVLMRLEALEGRG